jgi:hypothetical protein
MRRAILRPALATLGPISSDPSRSMNSAAALTASRVTGHAAPPSSSREKPTIISAASAGTAFRPIST